jgi:hypothetical protein
VPNLKKKQSSLSVIYVNRCRAAIGPSTLDRG